MAADLNSPAITGTAVIRHRAQQLGTLIHKMRVLVMSFRGKVLGAEEADALAKGLEATRIELGEIVELTQGQLQEGATALEAAHGVLKAIGAEGRLQPREPQPASFEGVYVPEPEKPQYLKDMARPSNLVILASVRRSRPEGGAR